jgi:hypothetical protein
VLENKRFPTAHLVVIGQVLGSSQNRSGPFIKTSLDWLLIIHQPNSGKSGDNQNRARSTQAKSKSLRGGGQLVICGFEPGGKRFAFFHRNNLAALDFSLGQYIRHLKLMKLIMTAQ